MATDRRRVEVKVRRVVVALDTASAPSEALEAAAGLARGLGAELVGLFVEDQRLLRFAELPFAQELGGATARAHPVNTADIERALKAHADRLRRLLSEAARSLDVPWTLAVARGQVVQAALEFAGIEDLLVMARARYLSVTVARPQAGQQFPSLRARTVAALFDGSPAAERALIVAHTLAQVAGCELAVIIPAAGPELFRARRIDAAEVLASRGGSAAAYVMVPGADPATVERAARAQRARVLLWPGGGREGAGKAVAALLADVSCPVVMIG
ncbi:MAG: hypothetical protein IT515_12995 [Burkholderiales bacterium]|nr:hypothetical protein [Burkholderiales bacterium]